MGAPSKTRLRILEAWWPLRYRLKRHSWGSVRGIGNSRMVKTSYVWLFVVPTAATLLLPFARDYIVQLPWLNDGVEFHFSISLPFSWVRFLMMAVAFTVGQGLYRIFCPELVRKYGSFGDFRSEHSGRTKLVTFVSEALIRLVRRPESLETAYRTLGVPAQVVDKFVLPDQNQEPPIQRVKNIAELCDNDLDKTLRDLPVMCILRRVMGSGPKRNDMLEPDMSELFDKILLIERNANRAMYRASAACFVIGSGLLVWVVLEGLVNVARLIIAVPAAPAIHL